jgi:capsid protein
MRFDMVRGIPELSPVINDLRYMHQLQKATLEKANMDAMNAWAVKRNGPSGPGNLGARGSSNGVDAVQFEKFETGRVHYLRPDESVESLASNTPGSQYLPFTQLSLRIIGSALCLPYEFMLLDFSQGSFSSSRAALLQTYRTFSGWQEWLTGCLLQRTWNWRIAKAIKAGELPPAPLDEKGVSQWYKVQWSYPEFGWVDPQSESTANQLDFNMGSTSLSAITRKKGRDAEDVLAEKAQDIATAIRITNEINKQTGSNLTWRDLIATLMPGQQPAATNQQPQQEPSNGQ